MVLPAIPEAGREQEARRRQRDAAFAVALQSDGKIVASGQAQNSYGQAFALARYNPDGTLESTFGTGGKVTTVFSGRDDAAHGVVIQPADGKIVAAGVTKTSTGEDFALARYNPNGTLDTTFGSGGLVTTDFAGRDDAAFAVALQSDAKIVAAGGAETGRTSFTYSRSDEDFALARYLG